MHLIVLQIDGIFEEVKKIGTNLNNFEKEILSKYVRLMTKGVAHKHSNICTKCVYHRVLFRNSEMDLCLSCVFKK